MSSRLNNQEQERSTTRSPESTISSPRTVKNPFATLAWNNCK